MSDFGAPEEERRGAVVRPTRRQWIDASAVVALMVVALYTFQSSFGGVRYLVVGVAAVVLGVVLTHIAESFRWPLPVTAAATLVTYAIVGGALALPNRALMGFLPSPDAAWAALKAPVTGWKELVTTAPPVGDLGDLMALPVASGMLGAVGAVILSRRFRSVAWAVLPPAVVLGLGIATGTDRPVSVVLHGAVFAALSIGWIAYRDHARRPMVAGASLDLYRLVGAGVMLFVAGGVGLVGASHLPFADASGRTIWRETVTPPFDPRIYPSPLAGYRHYVKQAVVKDQVMFTVEGVPEGVPVRLATMDAYDGMVWQVTSGDATDPSLSDSGSFERVGTTMPADFGGETAEVTVVIGEYNDVWVPDVGEVLRLRFEGSAGGAARDRQLNNEFRYNRATDTAASRIRLQAGDRYVMTVRLPTMMPDGLRGQTVELSVPRIGQVSPSVPDLVSKLAGPEILAIKDTAEQLDTVARLMSVEGTYSDGDRGAGQQGSNAGHSVARLNLFVAEYPRLPLIGNAEQYASAYALLFRDLGHIPTRVVMGFVPSADSTGGPVEVLAKQVESWVEVPVRGVGWVAIFPTPPRENTALSASAQQEPEPDYHTQNPPPPPVVDPEFDQVATSKGKAKSNNKPDAPEVSSTADGSSLWSNPIVIGDGVALAPVMLVVMVGGLFAALKARRRRRRRTSTAPHRRVLGGWQEIADHALDLGRPIPATATRREAGAFISPSAASLATWADSVVWAAGEPSDEDVQAYWSALDEAIGDLRSEVGPVRHFRAVMSPRSLRLRERFSRRARTIGSSAAPVWRPVRRVGARVQRVVPQRKGDAE